MSEIVTQVLRTTDTPPRPLPDIRLPVTVTSRASLAMKMPLPRFAEQDIAGDPDRRTRVLDIDRLGFGRAVMTLSLISAPVTPFMASAGPVPPEKRLPGDRHTMDVFQIDAGDVVEAAVDDMRADF